MMKITELLDRSADFHDAVIVELNWSSKERILRIGIEDLEINFKGMSDYGGPVAGSIELQGIEECSFEFELNKRPMIIYSFCVSKTENNRQKFEMKLRPHGLIKGFYTSVFVNNESPPELSSP
jgi:hypothetical protein